MNRIIEPSTWAGIAAMLEAVKFLMPQYAAVVVGVQAIAGGVAMVLRERGGE